MKITVIIPVKNGALTLERCLVSIRSQTVKDVDIIILDSMSTDNSNAIALQYDATIIDVSEGSFNHGLTRNLGVQYATGVFLFYTVQDAFLSENTLLERMANHFENEKIMGVVGHQAVPHEKDKNPMLWYKRFSEPEVQLREIKDVEQFKNSNQAVQQSLIAWDDVVAMYRNSALMQLPFADTQFAEDWIWSRDALMKGWKLIYDPSLVVYHYHHSDYSYAYKVAFTVNYHFLKYFNFKPQIPDLLIPMIKTIYHLGSNPELGFREKLYWFCHNFLSKLGTFNSHVNLRYKIFMGGLNSAQKRYNKVCRKIPQGNLRKSK